MISERKGKVNKKDVKLTKLALQKNILQHTQLTACSKSIDDLALRSKNKERERERDRRLSYMHGLETTVRFLLT
jgi:hypothetical protein